MSLRKSQKLFTYCEGVDLFCRYCLDAEKEETKPIGFMKWFIVCYFIGAIINEFILRVRFVVVLVAMFLASLFMKINALCFSNCKVECDSVWGKK